VTEQLKAKRGPPNAVRTHKDSKLASSASADPCEEHGITVLKVQAGEPQKNGFAQPLSGSFCYEFLGIYLFDSLS